MHKKFKYNNFLSAPSLVPGGLPFSVPPMNLSLGIGGYPYPTTSQAAVGLPSASLPPAQVTPPPASSDAAVAASSELTRSGNFDSANSSQSDVNNSNSSSPLNLSGGFPHQFDAPRTITRRIQRWRHQAPNVCGRS